MMWNAYKQFVLFYGHDKTTDVELDLCIILNALSISNNQTAQMLIKETNI